MFGPCAASSWSGAMAPVRAHRTQVSLKVVVLVSELVA